MELPNETEEKKKKPKKRKVGRPKKRGPKKKRKSRAKPKPDGRHNPKRRNTTDFKIVSCHNGKQDGYIGRYRTAEDAYADLERLIEESSKVEFPKMVENSGGINEACYEYLILEKNRHGDKEGATMRDQYGRLTRQETNIEDKWVVFDKVRYNVEETFWIFGMSPRSDRKTFRWIMDNMVLDGVDNEYDFKRVSVYRNKLIVRDDDNNIGLVLCKTQSEAIRLYNKIEEVTKDNGNVLMIGSDEATKERRKRTESELVELTGWDIYKVKMKKNRKG